MSTRMMMEPRMNDMMSNGMEGSAGTRPWSLAAQSADLTEPALRMLTMEELEDRVASGLHSGFKLKAGFICDMDNTRICDLILPLRWARRQDGSGYAVEVAFATRHRSVARMVLENVALNGSRAIARLADHGFTMVGQSSSLKRLLQGWRNVPDALRTDRSGWLRTSCEEVYMRADGTCLGACPTEPGPALLANPRPPQRAGTLAGWQEAVARPALGNDLMIFAICAALAAPLMRPAGMQTGTFHLHGKGPIGKSHLALIAASVDHAPTLRLSWTIDTERLDRLLEQTCDGLLDLDCLSENPSGRLLERLAGLGDEAVGPHDWSWHGIRLSTGERPLSNLLAQHRKIVAAAVTSRVIDIAAGTGSYGAFQTLHGHADADGFLAALRQGAEAHHGHLLPAFIGQILAGQKALGGVLPERIAAMASKICARADCPVTAVEGPLREALRRLALVAVAGEMAITFGLLPWPRGSATEALGAIAARWLPGQDGTVKPGNVVRRLAAFIAENRDVFSWLDAGSEADRADPERSWQDDTFIYLTATQANLIPGFRALLPELVKQGVVAPGDERNSWKWRMGRQFKTRPRYYRIRKDAVM
ncbi:DUF927 domain-containing protein [Paracoccus aestuarii]|uniref:DUF927 domain-containing protein n=2 Tax=Paracoccus aestuarii TaxID=453842 RepID=A0A418ZVE7_9RHOB|nr:DUF927 domain-containing protein [Paracoccus aestuarii]